MVRGIAGSIGRSSLAVPTVRLISALCRRRVLKQSHALSIGSWIMGACGRDPARLRTRIDLLGHEVELVTDLSTAEGLYLFLVRGASAIDSISLRLFTLLSRKARDIFDVGANIGVYSYAAALHSPESRIHAFEPTPRLAELIRLNAQCQGWSGRITVHEAAVADRGGSVEFFVLESDVESTIIQQRTEAHRVMETRRVPAVTLDETCAAVGADLSRSLFKIDTEGAEPLVLRGFQQSLRHPGGPDILLELLSGARQEGAMERLLDHGFRCFYVSPEGLVPVRSTAEAEERLDPAHHNFLFTKRPPAELAELKEAGLLASGESLAATVS